MKQIGPAMVLLIACTSVLADDAGDVKTTIEQHYAALNTQETETMFGHHLDDFTMFLADGSVLWEADFNDVSERMKATFPLPDTDVRMTHFNAQIYGKVAVATFYLVGTHTTDGNVKNITNRVSAVWVKEGRVWKEAHHHESPLDPGSN